MKLLIVTQSVDRNDPVLGFFHRWIEEFSKHCESVQVMCLKEGEHTLPGNVTIHSLGKESGTSRVVRLVRLFMYMWRERRGYDVVLVHMNQEYILVSGWLWKLLGKRIYMWRNHYAGSLLTDIAAGFCTKVFYTSAYSYTAKYSHAVRMPVGIDTKIFRPSGERTVHSILSLGRIAPSKNIHLILEALRQLKNSGVDFSASIYGDALPQDHAYVAQQKHFVAENKLGDAVRFYSGVPNHETPAIYSAHHVFVNASRSGMFDKTIFEAAACGAVVFASSQDWRAVAGEKYYFEPSALALAQKLSSALSGDAAPVPEVAQEHTLNVLANSLFRELAEGNSRRYTNPA